MHVCVEESSYKKKRYVSNCIEFFDLHLDFKCNLTGWKLMTMKNKDKKKLERIYYVPPERNGFLHSHLTLLLLVLLLLVGVYLWKLADGIFLFFVQFSSVQFFVVVVVGYKISICMHWMLYIQHTHSAAQLIADVSSFFLASLTSTFLYSVERWCLYRINLGVVSSIQIRMLFWNLEIQYRKKHSNSSSTAAHSSNSSSRCKCCAILVFNTKLCFTKRSSTTQLSHIYC